MYQVIHSNVLDWAKEYSGPKFHAVLCDPPYHLSGGFMGKDWDRDGPDAIAFQPSTWAVIGEHLYPGGFLMAFASSRGWHRLAVAIEDAGFVIHPSIFLWNQAQGFPKATRLDGRIDEDADEEQEIIGTAPVTPLAKAWAGHRYGLQAMKPAVEPVILAMKPYLGRPIDSITSTGAGALWIDGGRIKGDNGDGHWTNKREIGKHGIYGHFDALDIDHGNVNPHDGRWPSNFCLVHSPLCEQVNGEYQCVDNCPVRLLGEQSGERPVSGAAQLGKEINGGHRGIFGESTKPSSVGPNDTGTASRFYFNADWQYEVMEQLENAESVFYTPKAGRSERDAGLEEFTSTRVTPMAGRGQPGYKCKKCGKWKVSGSPCTCRNPEFEQVMFNRPIQHNPHPSIKPISLIKHLATLLLPPPMYAPRRILVPFSGAGSEMIGAMLSGWEEITGIELNNTTDEPYVDIANARLAWWSNKMEQLRSNDVDTIMSAGSRENKETVARKELEAQFVGTLFDE